MAMSGRYGWKAVRQRFDDALARMDPEAFERLVADYFRREGYRVEHIGTGGSSRRYDGGIDLKLFRDEEIIVVQCKRWTAAQVTHNPMHELIGVMHTSKATGAILVTSGEFSRYALRKAADVPGLRMIDGMELRRLLGNALPATIPPASDYSLSAPGTRHQESRVTYRPKPGPESALKDLMALAITIAIFFVVLRMCSTSNSGTTRPALRALPGAAAHVTPAPSPPVQTIPPELAPQPPAPTPPVIEKRHYQTPDEAMKVLEPNTPEV